MDFEYRKEKKIVYKKIIRVFLVWVLLFGGLIGYGVYWVFFDWSRFKQELSNESTSPDGTYTIKAYVSDGGATTSYAVMGELVFNKEDRRSKKIYWQYRTSTAEISWIDDSTVIINDVILRLPDETYDYRRTE